MRFLAFLLSIAATAFAQNLTEFGAAAAGSTIGGASGKSVSDGISSIFGKVDQKSASAATTGKEAKKDLATEKEPAPTKTSSGAASADSGGVPPPPPEPRRRTQPPPLPVAQLTVPLEAAQPFTLAEVAPVLPPPPVMSPEDFRAVASGMTRADVLKLGVPSARITMFEDGHLLEIYSYRQDGQKFGTLRLTDGVVSTIE